MRNPKVFRSRDIDLITFLRFKGFHPLGNPIEDSSGTRWAVFQDTPEVKKATFSYITGNAESRLLAELRKTRSYILDSEPEKEKR